MYVDSCKPMFVFIKEELVNNIYIYTHTFINLPKNLSKFQKRPARMFSRLKKWFCFVFLKQQQQGS